MMPLVRLGQVVFSMEHGPWTDRRWRQTAVESAHCYHDTQSPSSCPLWRAFGGIHIARDRMEEHRWGEDDYERELWGSIPDAWATMPAKISMSRWFGFFSTLWFWLKLWHVRLIALLFAGISLKLIRSDKLASIMPDVKKYCCNGG